MKREQAKHFTIGLLLAFALVELMLGLLCAFVGSAYMVNAFCASVAFALCALILIITE